MTQLKGTVGSWELQWKTPPHGPSGSAQVLVTGKQTGKQTIGVRWRRDEQGITVEFPESVRGYDLEAQKDDGGQVSYRVNERGSDREWNGYFFDRLGADGKMATVSKKKWLRVRAQMPGKILKVHVGVGAVVEKDQPLAVMEAMKMENEIRAPQQGRISKVLAVAGQAVETGADLFVIEPV